MIDLAKQALEALEETLADNSDLGLEDHLAIGRRVRAAIAALRSFVEAQPAVGELTRADIEKVVRRMGFKSLDPYEFAFAVLAAQRAKEAQQGAGDDGDALTIAYMHGFSQGKKATPQSDEARDAVLNRAVELHEKAGMLWPDAEELALSEVGIDAAAIDELIGECASSGLDALLTTPDDLRAFTRAVLVHQPRAAMSTTKEAR